MNSEPQNFDIRHSLPGKIISGDGAEVCVHFHGRAAGGLVRQFYRLHGRHFDGFRQLVAQHDPAGKFADDITRRFFASGAERDDVKGIERAA